MACVHCSKVVDDPYQVVCVLCWLRVIRGLFFHGLPKVESLNREVDKLINFCVLVAMVLMLEPTQTKNQVVAAGVQLNFLEGTNFIFALSTLPRVLGA